MVGLAVGCVMLALAECDGANPELGQLRASLRDQETVADRATMRSYAVITPELKADMLAGAWTV